MNGLCAGEIKQEDLDLRPDMPYFSTNNPRRTPKITYLHIYKCEQFSVIKLFMIYNFSEYFLF